MTAASDTKKLALINDMLTTLGDSPVDGLDIQDIDLIKAITKLDKISKDVQAEGWWCNTETIELIPVSGIITVPSNTLKIKDTDQYEDRGGQLYDLSASTFTIDEDSVELDLVLELDYDQMPLLLYNYIGAIANREFFLQEDGDRAQASELLRPIQIALKAVKDKDLNFKRPNMLQTNPTVSRIMNRLVKRTI